MKIIPNMAKLQAFEQSYFVQVQQRPVRAKLSRDSICSDHTSLPQSPTVQPGYYEPSPQSSKRYPKPGLPGPSGTFCSFHLLGGTKSRDTVSPVFFVAPFRHR